VNYADPLGLYGVDDVIYDLAQFSAGMGDNLSFGLTRVVRRAFHSEDVINACLTMYSAGSWTGTGLGVAFGAAHLGRNALLQANGSITRGIGRLFYDGRTWGTVRSMWSEAAGGGTAMLREAGQSLHHFLIPQRLMEWGIPRGIVNAGINYFPMTAWANSMMNGSTLTRTAMEWGLKGVVGGIYGSLFNVGKSDCSCGGK
jgi:hypothetical protein